MVGSFDLLSLLTLRVTVVICSNMQGHWDPVRFSLKTMVFHSLHSLHSMHFGINEVEGLRVWWMGMNVAVNDVVNVVGNYSKQMCVGEVSFDDEMDRDYWMVVHRVVH